MVRRLRAVDTLSAYPPRWAVRRVYLPTAQPEHSAALRDYWRELDVSGRLRWLREVDRLEVA